MSPLTASLSVHRRSDLAELGLGRSDVERLLRTGELIKLGRYWYGTPGTPRVVAASLARDRRPTCVSALALLGVWTSGSTSRHDVGLRGALPAGPGATDHRALRTWPDTEPIVPVPLALEHAGRCLDPEHAAIVFESVANKGLLDRQDLDAVLERLPARTRTRIGRVDGRAQSGTETRVRRYLERRGVTVEPQWEVRSVGFTDMRVGESLIIECDSRRHHEAPENYAEDRRRDQVLTLLGYRVVRLTWEDVMVSWPRTRVLLDELIRRRMHRLPRSQRESFLRDTTVVEDLLD